MKKITLFQIHIFFVLTVALVVTGALPSLAREAQDAGRISAIQGDVKLLREGAARDLKTFDIVRVNDTIRIGQNSMVKIIFYSDFHEEMIKGKSLAEISRKSAAIVEGSKDCLTTTRKPPVSTLPDNPFQNGRSIAAGLIKGETIFPRGNLSEGSETPHFSWENTSGARYYRVTINILKDEKSSEYINMVLKNNSYAVPAEKRLSFGTRYAFNVIAYENDPDAPTYKGMPDNIIASNENIPFFFIVPSKEQLVFMNEEEKKLRSLKKESSEWSSSASLLLISYMEFGLVDRAGVLAREMVSNGVNNVDVSRIAFRYAPRPNKK
jgi:hypothetical protein